MMEEGLGYRERRKFAHCYLSRIARWLSDLRRKRKKESKRNGLAGDRIVQVNSSTNGFNGEASLNSASQTANPGQCNREATVNLGVGCCLLYQIAMSKNELDKIMKTRMQMEKLLEDVREELQKKDGLSKPSEMNEMCAYSTTGSSTITVCGQSLRYETPKKGECSEGRDKLEAELEVELQSLQLHLDTVENSVKHPQQKGRSVTNDNTATSKSQIVSSGNLKWKVTDVNTATSKSQTVSSGEVVAFKFEKAAGSEEHCGVSPHELERRLHELLESRQQEQIRELEGMIECAKHKLREKEMEVSWWKDTACLISCHLPESSKLSSRHCAKLLSP
ncbi:hypothetical protein Peur_046319 [Populus x canadensis]|uniref:Protein POLAR LOCALIZATION DURING ASYMMETRIC DIVISION AND REDISTRIBUTION-like n=1 Tax=Populus deltoides TaxID=3696 RepID=A0A8T2YG08_POPDE|nr:hypothetical protein H0E87_011668 [Populus deltoides]